MWNLVTTALPLSPSSCLWLAEQYAIIKCNVHTRVETSYASLDKNNKNYKRAQRLGQIYLSLQIFSINYYYNSL
jgi:hypothetical protein